ncbi:helix-turn-helix domain-containing protein [Streptomyces odontomachi]|uniref:helix-turn-helix domain-containing protein n=1 Tax=Streptomyces odontomachi TaxID=2944940 RepID=UPI00210CBD02|nr:pyridoxamine 5'-phosphate oxidase family protein [Streptomyces sp. ODS25]
MPEERSTETVAAGTGHIRGDMGRRVATRREQLGLSREDVAARSGSAPGYLQYVEEHAASPGMGFLLRLADALETTVDELTGSNVDLPPGLGQAARRARLVDLSPEECRSLLGTHGVGRVAVTTASGPAILPVNYVVVDGDLAFRTSPEAQPAQAAGHDVAFEIDHIDDALSQGWSVLAVGPARAVTDAAAIRRLQDEAYTTPWAGDERNLWVAVTPVRLTGRRILVDDMPASGGE